jgi:hypothetical protein
LRHYDGMAWTPVTIPQLQSGYPISDIWGTSATDVWVAQNDRVHHLTGTTWTTFLGPARMLAGRAANDIYSANGGQVFHWDGGSWASDPSLTFELPNQNITGLAVTPGGSLYIGGAGFLLRRWP